VLNPTRVRMGRVHSQLKPTSYESTAFTPHKNNLYIKDILIQSMMKMPQNKHAMVSMDPLSTLRIVSAPRNLKLDSVFNAAKRLQNATHMQKAPRPDFNVQDKS
ncbi:hypothetical protein JI435_409770, partial [Parastagonospora nodorum SN15]